MVNTTERPHPAAVASDLPAARGGNVENQNANSDFRNCGTSKER